MQKKVLGILLSTIMIVGLLSGCGSSPAEPADSKPAEDTKTTSEPAQATDKEASAADSYPDKQVTMVVPFSAGGGTDLVCRALADAAKEDFPKNISVENREGSGGAIGMLYGANAAPDGSVITMITVELTTLEPMGTGAGLTYDMFKPIIMVNSVSPAVTVRADAPWNTLEEFIEYAKTNEVQVGNSGVGAIWHLAAADLAQKSGAQFKHVPYDGAAGAVTDLLGGHIDATTVSYAEVASQVDAGELKVLAVMSNERLEAIPDIPTCKEAGYDCVTGSWRGLAVPKDTPDEIVNKLYDIFLKAAQSDEFVKFMNDANNVIEILGPEEYTKKVEEESVLFTGFIEDLGISNK